MDEEDEGDEEEEDEEDEEDVPLDALYKNYDPVSNMKFCFCFLLFLHIWSKEMYELLINKYFINL